MDTNNFMTLDDRHEVFNLYSSQCAHCKFYEYGKYSCVAFPKGIPDDILEGKSKHDTVLENQTGETIYTPK